MISFLTYCDSILCFGTWKEIQVNLNSLEFDIEQG